MGLTIPLDLGEAVEDAETVLQGQRPELSCEEFCQQGPPALKLHLLLLAHPLLPLSSCRCSVLLESPHKKGGSIFAILVMPYAKEQRWAWLHAILFSKVLISLETELIDNSKFALDWSSTLIGKAMEGRMNAALAPQETGCVGEVCLKQQAKLNPAIFSLLRWRYAEPSQTEKKGSSQC